jgi:hypothetical protein
MDSSTTPQCAREGHRSRGAPGVGRPGYRLADLSVGRAEDDDPLEAYSWQDLREIIYESRGG